MLRNMGTPGMNVNPSKKPSAAKSDVGFDLDETTPPRLIVKRMRRAEAERESGENEGRVGQLKGFGESPKRKVVNLQSNSSFTLQS